MKSTSILARGNHNSLEKVLSEMDILSVVTCLLLDNNEVACIAYYEREITYSVCRK